MKEVCFSFFDIDCVKMRLILINVLFYLTATSALAQTTAPESDINKIEQCESFIENLNILKAGKDYNVRDIPEGCIVSNSIFDSSSYIGWSIERTAIEADNLKDYLSDTYDLNKTIPRWGRIAIDGSRMTIQSGRTISDYITSIQQWPMDISASYRFNPETGYLHIQNAEICSTKLGKASFSAEINLPIESTIASFTAHPSATLSHLRLRLDNQGMWESLALPILANYYALPSEAKENNPKADITHLQNLATKSIELIPENQISHDSRGAFLKFIQDMPHPAGFFTLSLEFDPPLPIDLDLIERGNLTEQAFDGGKLTVTYRAR